MQAVLIHCDSVPARVCASRCEVTGSVIGPGGFYLAAVTGDVSDIFFFFFLFLPSSSSSSWTPKKAVWSSLLLWNVSTVMHAGRKDGRRGCTFSTFPVVNYKPDF